MDTGTSSQEPILDYSQLSKSHLQDIRPSEREKHEAEFKKRTGVLLADIERTAPNLKALDQYDALQRKEKEVTERFEAARKEEREISDKYNSVKQRRYCPIIFLSPYKVGGIELSYFLGCYIFCKDLQDFFHCTLETHAIFFFMELKFFIFYSLCPRIEGIIAFFLVL